MYIVDLLHLRALTVCYGHLCPWITSVDDQALTEIVRVIVLNMTDHVWDDVPTVYLLSQSIYLTRCQYPTPDDKRLAEDYVSDLEHIIYQQLGNRFIAHDRGTLYGHVDGRLILLRHQSKHQAWISPNP